MNLPVQELNTDLLPTSHVNHTKYLTSSDRLLTPYPVVIPCSQFFAPKFKSTTGQFLAYTRNGVEKTTPPSSVINLEYGQDILYKTNDIEAISFDIGNGVYDFDKITDYEVLSIFSGAEDQIVSSFTRTATRNGNYETLSEGDISPERVFPSYPWKTIKNVLIDKFVFLENL